MTVHHPTPENSTLLLIDFQVGTIGWVHSTDQEGLKTRVVALTKAAKALNMPIVLTSSQEDQAQGPLLPKLVELLPEEHAARIQRTGVVNAMDDPSFAAAVEDTGRRNVLIAGITNDVCTVFPTLTLLDEGYHVSVVADAGGSITQVGDDAAVRRMEMAGAQLTSTNQLLAELAVDWASPKGAAVLPSILDLIPREFCGGARDRGPIAGTPTEPRPKKGTSP